MKKLNKLRDLPDDFILSTIDVVGLYPNIPHKEGLEAIRKALHKRKDQTISMDSLFILAECVLKNNVFEQNIDILSNFREQPQGLTLHHRTLFCLWII